MSTYSNYVTFPDYLYLRQVAGIAAAVDACAPAATLVAKPAAAPAKKEKRVVHEVRLHIDGRTEIGQFLSRSSNLAEGDSIRLWVKGRLFLVIVRRGPYRSNVEVEGRFGVSWTMAGDRDSFQRVEFLFDGQRIELEHRLRVES